MVRLANPFTKRRAMLIHLRNPDVIIELAALAAR